jgi:cytochrome c-type biogenesis protein CcmH
MTGTCRLLRNIPGVAALILLAFVTTPACAVTPDEVLQDTRLETRARQISQVLRCVVCQNQSIDDSNAPLAHDLRVLLRERLASGDTDQQAVDYIVARYGNFVLLKPPVQLDTLFLWAGPALFFLIAAIGTGRYLRRSIADVKQASEPLSATEQARLAALLDRGSA